MRNIAGKSYRVLERKSSKFGALGIVDRGNELERQFRIFDRRQNIPVTLNYYNNLKRLDIYRTAIDKYVHDQLARPIINLISFAIFSEPPDIQGDKDQVKIARKIIRDSSINWKTWGADLEVHGDVFLMNFPGKNPKIASLPPHSIEIDYNENNIIDIRKYVQNIDLTNSREIAVKRISHGKINNVSSMIYGSSTLRAIFWWLDVLDNLWERNWIRAAQYYGAPIVAISGIPGDFQATVKASLESEGQRPGKNWVFPENVKAETLDFTKNYPIQDLVDRVYQYILSACNIPQHLIYESDSSRGVAMFSGDAFEMMIKQRRETWTLVILEALKKLMVNMGMKPDEFNLKIGWAPVFTRDLKALAQLIQVGMENKLFSRKSARERLKLDHSEEIDNLKKQKLEEPDEELELKKKALDNKKPPKVAPKPKTKNSK